MRALDKQRSTDDKARAQADATLAVSGDPSEILSLIQEHQGYLTKEACKEAWVRVARNGSIKSSHDLVTVSGHSTVAGSFRAMFATMNIEKGAWCESRRTACWHAPKAARFETGWTDGRAHIDELSLWLDSYGDVFAGRGYRDPALCLGPPPGHELVVMGRAQPIRVVAKRGSPRLHVEGGVDLVRPIASPISGWGDGTARSLQRISGDSEDREFVRAVSLILRALI